MWNADSHVQDLNLGPFLSTITTTPRGPPCACLYIYIYIYIYMCVCVCVCVTVTQKAGLYHSYSSIPVYYKVKVKLATRRLPFRYLQHQVVGESALSHFTIDPYLIILTVKVASNTNFWVFGMTRPGIEPRSPRPFGEHSNHYANVRFIVIDEYS